MRRLLELCDRVEELKANRTGPGKMTFGGKVMTEIEDLEQPQ